MTRDDNVKGKYRVAVLITGAVALCAPIASAEQVYIDTPLSGWRNSQGERVLYTQTVNYPASSVNLQDEQAISATIRGRIEGASKEGPATLIVNGIPMPLSVEGGAFARPYAFGAGSNSVEVRAPGGESRTRVQFYEAYAEKTQPKVRVVLSWNTDGTDLDLHVITPDGGHSFYGDRVLDNGGALDVDVTTGYGPEIFSLPGEVRGTYLVYVNYYGSGSDDSDITVANVTVIVNEGTVDEKVQSFHVPLRKAGELTRVASFSYP